MLKEVTRYECSYCKGLFKTPNKHKCKMDPKLKNCYGCKHCDGFEKETEFGEYAFWPNCKINADAADPDDFTDRIWDQKYNLQCEKFESRFPDPEQEEQIPGQVEIEDVLDEQNTDWLEEVLDEQNES